MLDACGDDVNEAIKRLGKLQLTVAGGQVEAKPEASTHETANGHTSDYDAQKAAQRQSGLRRFSCLGAIVAHEVLLTRALSLIRHTL